jgi:hypothetical protein
MTETAHTPTVSLRLTERQLFLLMEGFHQSYSEGNPELDDIANVLTAAHRRARAAISAATPKD